jgi:hypothetical protein
VARSCARVGTAGIINAALIASDNVVTLDFRTILNSP